MCALKTGSLYERFLSSVSRFGPFETFPVVAVAVSGGGDSLALTFLLHQWVQGCGGKLIALHVDHGLRPTSRHEALTLQSWLEAKGIDVHVLSWYPSLPLSNIQEKARDARYHFLKTFCENHHILHLFLAHHRQDQEETYFYRLSKKSGPDGLAGMAAIEEQASLRLLRPLLDFSKQELKEVLGDHPFIQDPSNINPAFWRPRFRLENAPLEAPHLKDLGIKRYQREKVLAAALGRYVCVSDWGYATLQEDVPEDLKNQVWGHVLTTIGGHGYPVGSQMVTGLLKRLPVDKTTAGGCLIMKQKGSYFVTREWGRLHVRHDLDTSDSFLWDGRFLISDIPPSFVSQGIYCAALGEKGWRQVRNNLAVQPYSHHIYKSLPAFFNTQGEVFFLPFGDFKSPQRMVDSPKVLFLPKSRLLRSLWFI